MMKRMYLLCLSMCMCICTLAQTVTTASSSMTANPWAVHVPYDVADEGTEYQFMFGMGGWSWDFFAFQ